MLQRTAYITLILVFGFSLSAWAQHHEHARPSAAQTIEQQVAEGELSYEDGLLQRFEIAYGVHDAHPEGMAPLSTDDRFAIDYDYRCTTPLMAEFENQRDQLSADTEQAILQLIEPSDEEQRIASTYTHPDSIFKIHYTTDGDHAVDPTDTNHSGIPDYVERVAEAADSSYQVLVEESHFIDPRADTQELYDIYIKELSTNLYGEAVTISDHNSTQIHIRNNYEDFPDNDDPEGNEPGAMKVTVAHELFHAIQYQYTSWLGPSSDGVWIEMDAVMVEDVVFPYVNDYRNYLGSINSIFSTPHHGPPGSYWHTTWLMYYKQQFGIGFWREVWEGLAQKPLHTIPQVKALIKEEETLRKDRVRNHLWHLSSGEQYALENYGFKAGKHYPNAYLTENIDSIPGGFRDQFSLSGYDARYYRYEPGNGASGNFRFGFFNEGDGLAAGLMGVMHNGEVKEQIFTEVTPRRLIDTGWEATELQEVRIVVTGTDQAENGDFNFVAGAGDGVESVRYGDFEGNGFIREQDTDKLLEALVRQEAEISGKFRGDVSADGELSAFDASLIFRHAEGEISGFPADHNDSGFGPNVSDFEAPSALASDRIDHSGADVLWTIDLLTEHPKTDSGLDIGISIEVGKESEVQEFLALMLMLEVPEWITYDNVQFFQALEGARSAAYRNRDTLLVAVAGKQPFGEGELLTLNFEPEAHEDAEIKLTSARLDEYPARQAAGTTGPFEIEQQRIVEAEEPPDAPQQLTLHGNYPNPFNPATTIEFELPEPGHTRLAVYDLNGREVATLTEGQLEAGSHQVNFDGSGLSSGMYIYHLKAPSGMKTGKMMLVK